MITCHESFVTHLGTNRGLGFRVDVRMPCKQLSSYPECLVQGAGDHNQLNTGVIAALVFVVLVMIVRPFNFHAAYMIVLPKIYQMI